jgi:putative ABC transport system permease protein
LANFSHLKVGDVLELPAPNGSLKLPIAAIIQDFADQQGSIFVDSSVYSQYWKNASIDLFRVYLNPDASPRAVKAGIREKFSSQRRIFVYLE